MLDPTSLVYNVAIITVHWRQASSPHRRFLFDEHRIRLRICAIMEIKENDAQVATAYIIQYELPLS
jgi:hypothetical protein